MAQWYYQVLGDILGPVDEEELRQKLQSGQLPPGTLVAPAKNGPWEEAREVFHLSAGADPGEELSAAALGGQPEGATATLPAIEAPQAAREVAGKSPLALRPCSDCGWMVSREASVCPRCGRIFHEASSLLTYHGEHPVSVMIFFTLLAVFFLIGSPILVYFCVAAVAEAFQPEGSVTVPLVVTALYIISMVVCALLGGAVGKPRMAYITGLLLGLFFGPLGVFVAYAIDKRPECPHCSTRLNGLARQCPMCHARLLWRVVPTWV
ncbi:MAG: DUF4339 domain-containing protein [Thermoguttaceae bacterium]|nr:DUF4339 domain-containing protein [Thermoguttaceae bacterium]MDW8080049.1 DUF4339 domain-containing protein [Thermoguttaceae bacterium]